MLSILLLLLLSAAIGTIWIILPASVLMLVPSTSTLALYRAVVRFVQHWWLAFAAALIEKVARVRVTVSGCLPRRGDTGAAIIVCNHHCRLDWMFLWCLCARAGWLGALTIMLKSPLKQVPLFGWACQAFHFVFLRRNDRKRDLETIGSLLRYLVALGVRPVVLVFPEGTDLSPANRARADEHAAAKGVDAYRHVLHPRTAGFVAAVRALGAELDAVYDVTVSYDNHARTARDADPRPNEKALFARAEWPHGVHFHVERTPAAVLRAGGQRGPGGGGAGEGSAAVGGDGTTDVSDEALGKWLHDAWEAKERRLARAEAAPVEALLPTPTSLGVELGMGAAVWATCALGIACAWSRAMGAAALGGCAVWFGASKVCGGLGELERRLHERRVLSAVTPRRKRD